MRMIHFSIIVLSSAAKSLFCFVMLHYEDIHYTEPGSFKAMTGSERKPMMMIGQPAKSFIASHPTIRILT